MVGVEGILKSIPFQPPAMGRGTFPYARVLQGGSRALPGMGCQQCGWLWRLLGIPCAEHHGSTVPALSPGCSQAAFWACRN